MYWNFNLVSSLQIPYCIDAKQSAIALRYVRLFVSRSMYLRMNKTCPFDHSLQRMIRFVLPKPIPLSRSSVASIHTFNLTILLVTRKSPRHTGKTAVTHHDVGIILATLESRNTVSNSILGSSIDTGKCQLITALVFHQGRDGRGRTVRTKDARRCGILWHNFFQLGSKTLGGTELDFTLLLTFFPVFFAIGICGIRGVCR